MNLPIKRFSVSMLTTFGTPDKPSCRRKMAFNYLTEGMKSPPSAAQQRGIELHDTLEKIAKQGPFEIPEKHQIYVREVQAQEHLPAPGENALIEHWMTMPTQFGIPFVGKIDLVRYQTEPPRLIDWKSAGDLRYMLTPTEIADDVQTNVYARYLFEEGLSEPLTGGLVYIEMPKTPPKKKAKVIPRLIDLTKRQSAVVWDSIQPVLEEMLEVAELDHPNDVEPNTAICSKYGGCPFRGECGIPMFATLNQPKHQPAKKKDEEEMGFADRLKAAKQNGTPAPEVKAASVPEVKAAPAKAAVKDAPAQTAVPTFTEKMRARKAAAAEGLATVAGVVPPDAPPRDSGGADPLPVEVKDEAEVIEVETVEPKRRGRPKGSVEKKGFVLYIDCLPTRGGGEDITMADDWFGPIEMKLNELAAEENKRHWMLLDFGPQKAALGLFVQEKIKSGGLPPTMLVRSSSSSFNRDVLPLLRPHATLVVEALRG